MGADDEERRGDGRRFTREWSEEIDLEDGTPVLLRLLRPEDRSALLDAFQKLSPQSRYTRFFTAMPRLPPHVLDALMQSDEDHVAIVAGGPPEAEEAIEGYGVARFARVPDPPRTAEAAVTVADHMHRRGLGTLLLSRLIEAARERGIETFRVEILRNNAAVNALLHDFDTGSGPEEVDGPMAVYQLSLAGEPAGPLFRLLNLAAKGVEIFVRHLPSLEPRASDRGPEGGARDQTSG